VSTRPPTPILDLSFPHNWQAEVLAARPLILPPRHYTYPRDAEEVERGALEVLIRPNSAEDEKQVKLERSPSAQEFLATCALGFRDPAVPTGLWSTPNPDEICSVSGGYAYLIRTNAPEQFTMLPYRPVLEIRPLPAHGLLLFIGHHALLAWGAHGEAWQSEKLSDEGITLTAIENDTLDGQGWDMRSDKETAFALDLRSGARTL
jgi:hypothetical protein